MNFPLQVTIRGMVRSEALAARVQEHAEKLAQYFDGITDCRVVIEEPHHHQRHGNHFRVRIDLAVPGREIVADRDPKNAQEHEDAYVAVRDAFDAAKRQLQDYAHKLHAH